MFAIIDYVTGKVLVRENCLELAIWLAETWSITGLTYNGPEDYRVRYDA